jgi:ribose transport system permease protein
MSSVTTEPKTSTQDSAGHRPSTRQAVLTILERYALVAILGLLCLFFSVYQPTREVFPAAANWRGIVGNETVVAVAALALVLPLVCNQFDLSVGSIVGSTCIASTAAMARFHLHPVLAVVIGIGLGGVIGLCNGVIVARLGVNSLIATLGTSSLIAGLVSLYTKDQVIGSEVGAVPEGFTNFGARLWLGVPRVTYAVIVIALLVYYVQQHTPYGRYLASVGASPTSARLVGLRVENLMLSSFVASGLLAGVGGVLLLCRAGTANPQVGPGYTLAALSAAFLGATTIRPGRFNVLGTILGVLFVAVSVNGLVLAGSADWVEPTFDGAALVIAVSISLFIARRRAGRT